MDCEQILLKLDQDSPSPKASPKNDKSIKGFKKSEFAF